MRNILIFVLAILLLGIFVFLFFFFLKKPVAKYKIKSESYFPSPVGSYWTYTSNKGKTFLYQISRSELKDGKLFFDCEIKNNFTKDLKKGWCHVSTLELTEDNNIISLNKIRNFLFKNGDMVFNPPIEFLNLSLKNGQEWREYGKVRVNKAIETELKVLGKKMKVYKVGYSFFEPKINSLSTNTMWLAKGIGMVKESRYCIETNDYEILDLIDFKIAD